MGNVTRLGESLGALKLPITETRTSATATKRIGTFSRGDGMDMAKEDYVVSLNSRASRMSVQRTRPEELSYKTVLPKIPLALVLLCLIIRIALL